MVNVEKHLYKVRYKNAGDDFHEIWAARRILRLIDPRNDLVAVSIEGISEKEKSGTKAGLLVVDMVEYFGAEVFWAARQIVYTQLKHSTTNRSKPWSAGELGEVIEGFADRFKELVKLHGKDLVESKIRFQFVTNRPISPNVISALRLAVNQKGTQLGGHIPKTFNTMKEKYGIDDGNFTIFLILLTLTGRERDRYGQERALEEDAQRLIPDFDANVRSRLKSLVHKMTLPENRDDPTIRKDDLLAALDIVAIRVDAIARDLVTACAEIAIFGASKEEEEWLRTGLNFSTHNDMNAKIIIKLIEKFKEQQKEAPERLAMRRFQEFAQICLEIAEGLRSYVTDSGSEDV